MPDPEDNSSHARTYFRDSHVSSAEPRSFSDAPSKKDTSSSRNSPVPPLAPLEYLQNQRRGSITDPSLHASNPSLHINSSKSNNAAFRPPELLTPNISSTSREKIRLLEPRPMSPYVFGDATPHSSDPANIRRLLRSPSIDGDDEFSLPSPKENQNVSSGPLGRGLLNGIDRMDVDDQSVGHFNHSMRRHSIAVGQGHYNQQLTPHNKKRKMSVERVPTAAIGEEIDPQLGGPGVPSGIGADTPPTKRRGSTVDTQRIAQLSLYDQRRNSVDSRGTGGGGQWWANDRRDGKAQAHTPEPGGYAPGFAGDSTHSRTTPTFAWTASPQPEHTMEPEVSPSTQTSQRPFEAQMSIIPPVSIPSDRRMSIQENVTSAGSTGPTRVLRSRSRPPSRQLHSSEPPSANQAGPSSAGSTPQDESLSTPSPTIKSPKDQGSTPYSRSPELRVSHKLAERKRRKEMKDLFDELRDQLPADRGMKASKWEILTKAIEFVVTLKQSHQEMAREIDALRHELDALRQGGVPLFGPGASHPPMYAQPVVPGQYVPVPPGGVPPQPGHPQPQTSRPPSSPNVYSSGSVPQPTQNGNVNRLETSPT